MRVIVIGASGKIGYQLYIKAKKEGVATLGTYNQRQVEGLVPFDMCNSSLEEIAGPLSSEDIVYLLSAYSAPSWIFKNQETSRDLNITATKKIIDECAAAGARVMFVSSVEVFDGENPPYSETSIPNPLNLYGQMKVEIEHYLRELAVPHCIIRTGWSVGWEAEQRCVIKFTYDALRSGEAVMAHDNSFSISDVRDLGACLYRLASEPDVSCCHMSSSPALLRTELADAVIHFSKYGSEMSYTPIKFQELEYTEGRARNNDIDSSFAVKELGCTFRDPIDIIREKVELLDQRKE